MRQAKNRFFLLPLFFVLACVGLYAQANSELTGIVVDQTGAVVAGAKIVLTEPATAFTKTTESGVTGLFDIAGLNPGSYTLTVTAKGFEKYTENGIVINVSMTFRRDVKLTVGAESQTVEVQADALTVQTDSNVVSSLISSEQISEIATENRNFAALAALGLGVSSALPDSNTPTSVAANFTISVNGLRQSHNIWLIDGGEADDRGGAGGMDIMPSQDAIAEFNMLSSNYPPDYGISSGATMSLSLKSGTQKFHGELYEFNRNTDYDANSYFDKIPAVPTPRAPTHYNIFGGNAGGPIFIPHVYNSSKQKSFFFFNLERRAITSSAGTNVQHTIDPADLPKAGTDLTYVPPTFGSNQIVVPNVSETTWYYQKVLKPAGLTPNGCWIVADTTLDKNGNPQCKVLNGQVIPHTLFGMGADPTGKPTFGNPDGILYINGPVFPAPSPGLEDTNTTTKSNPITVNDYVVRIDHKFNDKWAILGHYMEDQVTQGYALPELGWLWASYNTLTSTLSNPSDSAAIKLSGTINPNLLVEASINYDGNVINITPSANSVLPSGWAITPITPSFAVTRNVLPGMSYIGPYGVAEDTGSEPWHNAARDYEPKVDVSYTMGKHEMKYGFSYNRYTKNQQIFGDEQGFFSPSGSTNDSLMDMLLGLTSGYSQDYAVPIRHYVNQTPSAYLMDNWHMSPRLSVQLGIRYDALPHAWERNNAIGNFNPDSYIQSAAPIWTAAGTIDPSSPTVVNMSGNPYAPPLSFYLNGMGLEGVNGFPKGLVTNDYNTWQPRIGFSDDLFGNGKTVLRGGFGTFFERMQGNDIYNAATSPPFIYNAGTGNPSMSQPGFNWTNGQNAASQGLPIFVPGVTNIAHTYKAPAVAMYSLGVQHELSPSIVWVVQYVGNNAWHQNIEHQINTFPLSAIGENVTIPEGGGVNASVAVTCLSGDSGNHFGYAANGSDEGSYDANCKPGFQSFPGQANQFRAYQGYGGVTQEENTTNGTYNGFQTGVRIQNRWGLSGEVDYTYSHEIDITSYDLSGNSDPWNLKYDKGSGALDRRHILSANYVYKLPIFAKSTGFAHSIAGGWEIAGTAVDETGLIATVTGSGGICCSGNSWDPVGMDGGYTVRPNISGKMDYPKKTTEWFDWNKFSNVVPQWLGGPNMGFGTTGKDAVVGPGRVNFTTSLYKSFAMTERAHFELRFESFNTFNHSEWNGINTGFNPQNGNSAATPFGSALTKGNTFGQVNSTWDPRVLELGGKFVF